MFHIKTNIYFTNRILLFLPQISSNGSVVALTVRAAGVGRSREAGSHLGRFVTGDRLCPSPAERRGIFIINIDSPLTIQSSKPLENDVECVD